jgi:bacterioferritin
MTAKLAPSRRTSVATRHLNSSNSSSGSSTSTLLPISASAVPLSQTLDALQIGKTVKEIMERDLQAEITARALYAEAATYCHSVAEYVSRDLFEELTHDEEDHIDFLETQLNLIGKIGVELYTQRHLGKLE